MAPIEIVMASEDEEPAPPEGGFKLDIILILIFNEFLSKITWADYPIYFCWTGAL
jgi:hypothetical protein